MSKNITNNQNTSPNRSSDTPPPPEESSSPARAVEDEHDPANQAVGSEPRGMSREPSGDPNNAHLRPSSPIPSNNQNPDRSANRSHARHDSGSDARSGSPPDPSSSTGLNSSPPPEAKIPSKKSKKPKARSISSSKSNSPSNDSSNPSQQNSPYSALLGEIPSRHNSPVGNNITLLHPPSDNRDQKDNDKGANKNHRKKRGNRNKGKNKGKGKEKEKEKDKEKEKGKDKDGDKGMERNNGHRSNRGPRYQNHRSNDSSSQSCSSFSKSAKDSQESYSSSSFHSRNPISQYDFIQSKFYHVDHPDLANIEDERRRHDPYLVREGDIVDNKIVWAGGCDPFDRITHIPHDAFIPIYQWDLVQYTAVRYPEFYTWIPTRKGKMHAHQILLIPLGCQPPFYIVEILAFRNYTSQSPPPISLRIDKYNQYTHISYHEEVNYAVRILSATERSRQGIIKLPIVHPSYQPDLSDPNSFNFKDSENSSHSLSLSPSSSSFPLPSFHSSSSLSSSYSSPAPSSHHP